MEYDANELKIDRNGEVSISEQIAGGLLSAILENRVAPGERLPTERELAERLGVSRGTVKRAYARLAESGAIEMRQGSGSYVLKNNRVLEENQKKEAAALIAASFHRLRATGLSDQEILSLVHLHALGTARGCFHKLSLMVVSNNHDILSELERQLDYLTEASPFLFTLSFLTLDTIAGSPEPLRMLLGYDLIIATTIDYASVLEIAPMFRHKILEAHITPRTGTLSRLSTFPENTRFRVVYRTGIFRDLVLRSLLSLGFGQEQIFCRHELEYNPARHSEDGVRAVINFNESPVLLSDAFQERNRAFEQEGGQILRFEYQIERGSLIFIENRIQNLLSKGINH